MRCGVASPTRCPGGSRLAGPGVGSVVGNLNAVRHRSREWTEIEVRAKKAYAKVIGVTLDLAVQTVEAGRTQQPEPGLRPGLMDVHEPGPDKGL